jgi:hypothetical protein
MDSTVTVAIIGAVSTLLGILIPIWYRQRSAKTTEDVGPKSIEGTGTKAIEGSGHVGQFLLTWMKLSDVARKKLGQSQFIPFAGTENALMTLVGLASKKHSILAICGYKGPYSTRYYEENFQSKAVRRIFSYEAIRNEIEVKDRRFALDGLKMHLDGLKIQLDRKPDDRCDVEVSFIPKGKYIKDVAGGNFEPPLSFGLAILRDGNDSPSMAVTHWEIDAKPLKHLIAIEGVIVDEGQEELLNELVTLHASIAGSAIVFSSRKDLEKIEAAYEELEEFWKSHQLTRERSKG